MLNRFLQFLMFGFTMFAAGAPAIGGSSGDGGAAGDVGGFSGGGSEGHLPADGDDGGVSRSADGDSDLGLDGAVEQSGEPHLEQHPEDKDTADLKGLVSHRLVALKKEAPELAQVFQKYPKIQEQVEAAFRRDMAYRELYPTIAEARQMREQFPNGMADVEQMLNDANEINQLDQNFYSRDATGQYPGHQRLIENMFQDDNAAAVSLFRSLPKLWARLDPDSYSEVMGQVVGSTLSRAELPDWITELRDAAKDAKQDGIAASLDKMLRWATGFSKAKPEPTEQERRLDSERATFKRQQDEQKTQDFNRFKQGFFTESGKQQNQIVQNHSAIKQMLATKSISDAKKSEIVQKVRSAILGYLKTSRAYTTKLNAAYQAGNVGECLKIEKAQWSYPWILNKFVRQVLAEETPNLVRQNRERTGQPASRPAARPPVKTGPTVRTAPYKEDGVWKKKDGTRFTTAELLRGLHLQA